MTRTVMRYAEWTIGQDTSEGASPPLYEVECTTCDAKSGVSESAGDAQDWALQHSGRNPSHTGFRGINTTFWRTTMGGDGDAGPAFIGRRDAAPIVRKPDVDGTRPVPIGDVWPDAPIPIDGCLTCERIVYALAGALGAADASASIDARVLLRRHLVEMHGQDPGPI